MALNGWYLVGPALAAGLVLAAAVRHPPQRDRRGRQPRPGGLTVLAELFADRADYGLLRPVAYTDDAGLADDILGLLAAGGIRATHATRPGGRVVVLVFDADVEEARRLMDGSAV